MSERKAIAIMVGFWIVLPLTLIANDKGIWHVIERLLYMMAGIIFCYAIPLYFITRKEK